MLDLKSVVFMLLFNSWSVTTIVLVGVLVYRGILSTKEDDQIFVDAAEQHYYEEQQTIITRMSSLRRSIVALSVVSSLLFLSTVGAWIYRGFSSF
jgi:hypothetical protein